MRLSFLRDTSDRVELEDRESGSSVLEALEGTASDALGTKWDERLEPTFISNIGRYRRYKYDSVRDLLRVMRNKLNHYRELPTDIQVSNDPISNKIFGSTCTYNCSYRSHIRGLGTVNGNAMGIKMILYSHFPLLLDVLWLHT